MTLPDERSDAALLGDASDDPDAFAAFYRRYERLVLAYLMRACANPEVAADLCAEVFASALRSAPRYRPQSPSAVAWLLAIAQNTLRGSVRRGRVEARARRALGIREAISFDHEELERIEALSTLDGQALALLEQLPADQREAIHAHVLEDRSYREIAGELQLSELAVRKRVSRGLLWLRARIEECAMTILPKVEKQLREAAERQAAGRQAARRRRRRVFVTAVSGLAAVAALLVFALAGGGGGAQFDVAAAVYRALPVGPGVLYTVTEEEDEMNGSRSRTRMERWRVASPSRERSVSRVWRNYGRERVWRGEAAIPAGGTWSSWSTFRPGVIEHSKARGVLRVAGVVEPSTIRAAYQSGALRVVGKGEFEGTPVYRLEVDSSRCSSRCQVRIGGLMVDARTFLPIYVEYARDRQGRRVPRFVLRYLVYKELPLTSANVALLAMRPHPGARVLERR
jgi:RNA polymerase sigma-70 factor (ECF subfamily)